MVAAPSPPLGSDETPLIRIPKPSRRVNGLRGKAIGGAARGPYGRDASYGPEEWDESRAGEVCAAIHARVEKAVAAIPADHPHRQARLNVLANERGIVVGLMARHDPMLWGWLAGLEHLLERWREWDRGGLRK